MALLQKPFQAGPRAAPAGRARRVRVVCAAQQAVSGPSRGNPVLMAAVEALFKFPPFFNFAAGKARGMMRQRIADLGGDWDAAMLDMPLPVWEARLQAVRNPAVQYPAYYTQPFHAYSQGNLCWGAALEFSLATQAAHALVMDPAGKQLDADGDVRLRDSYSARMAECMAELGADPAAVRTALDLGCATGVSSLALLRAFPAVRQLTGLDLSPHFLAVGAYEQAQRVAARGGAPEPLTLLHGAAEATGLAGCSQDLVSICLVCHELPREATAAIMREAFRVLRPGGVMALMDMNPQSPIFRRVLDNPFAFTAFKSTEPWLQEYIELDMPGELRAAGFADVAQRESSPRHKTVVAIKR